MSDDPPILTGYDVYLFALFRPRYSSPSHFVLLGQSKPVILTFAWDYLFNLDPLVLTSKGTELYIAYLSSIILICLLHSTLNSKGHFLIAYLHTIHALDFMDLKNYAEK